MNDPATPRPRDVRRRFDRAADRYDDADFLARQAGDALLERLQPVQLDARRVLNLGAATGRYSALLGKRFPKARVLSLDLSRGMLDRARERRPFLSRRAELQASAEALPLAGGSMDAVLANLVLPWLGDPARLFGEAARVLRKEGLFAFSTLGPDSLAELRALFGDDGDRHVRPFVDMHDLGDALLKAGLRDPVLDVDRLTVRYDRRERLMRDLEANGARNSLKGRRRTLTGRRRWDRFSHALDAALADGGMELTFELVYGHAFGSGGSPTSGEFRFDVADLVTRRPPR